VGDKSTAGGRDPLQMSTTRTIRPDHPSNGSKDSNASSRHLETYKSHIGRKSPMLRSASSYRRLQEIKKKNEGPQFARFKIVIEEAAKEGSSVREKISCRGKRINTPLRGKKRGSNSLFSAWKWQASCGDLGRTVDGDRERCRP